MRATHLVMALCSASLVTGEAGADRVLRRGGAEPVEGMITRVDDAGVTVKSELGASHLISWDRIRAVEGDRDDPQLERRLDAATELWRARSRLERHDAALAEPLFDRLFEEHLGQNHETALVVAEGVLRCRIARGAHAAAVIPALEVARLRRRDVRTVSYTSLEPVIDEPTALCPMLAPAWVDARGLVRLERDLAKYDAQGDEVVESIARLYHRAVRRQLGMSDPDGTVPSTGHAGAELLELVVQCDDPSADRRSNARERLVRTMDERPAWCDAWIRFHVGRSLLEESGVGRQQRGLVSLAHLPARHANDQPYLAGLALWYIAAGLERTGEAAGAAELRNELSRRFPGHPIHLSAPPMIEETTHEDST